MFSMDFALSLTLVVCNLASQGFYRLKRDKNPGLRGCLLWTFLLHDSENPKFGSIAESEYKRAKDNFKVQGYNLNYTSYS
jgi:hypothetical protein